MSSLFALRNSAKTQSVCKTPHESLQVPLLEMIIHYCSFCDFYQNAMTTSLDHYEDADYYCTTQISETQRNYQNWLFQHIEHYFDSPVAEIGPGDGFFGQLISSKFDYVGFEPARKSHAECRRKHLNVVNSYFYPSPQKYKAIIGRQVLEHIADLTAFLRNVRDSIDKDGFIIFEVPNIEKAKYSNRIIDFCPEHLNYFTQSSLSLLFSSTGFNIKEIVKTYNDEYLLIVANRNIQFKLVDKTLDLNSMIFWGAGSRGISLLHLLNVKPVYFVDSDSDKWGKYIPSTTIEIKSPQFFYEDEKCKAVVITSFFYFDEVLQDLKRNGFKGKIFKFNERYELVSHENS